MAIQTVFKRYELKYILTQDQKNQLLQAMAPYMALDRYGRTTIRNIYFDTDTYLLIRRSIEKPEYKEKLRIRSYEKAGAQDIVFVELKKKYQHVVYKRRVTLPESEAMDWLCGTQDDKSGTQISEEVNYFLQYYRTLHPTVFLSYEREAFYSSDGSDFRVTFDENILCREDNISLGAAIYGMPLLQEGTTLMEIKCSGGIPMWMAQFLSANGIYKTSFSKYGTAYEKMIYPKLYRTKENMHYA